MTLRPVVQALRPLTFTRGSAGREPDAEGTRYPDFFTVARAAVAGAGSDGFNCHDYWLEHCHWEVRHDRETVRNENRFLRFERHSP